MAYKFHTRAADPYKGAQYRGPHVGGWVYEVYADTVGGIL